MNIGSAVMAASTSLSTATVVYTRLLLSPLCCHRHGRPCRTCPAVPSSSGGGVAVNQFTDEGSEGDPGKDVGRPVGSGADTGVGDGGCQGDEHHRGDRAAASGGGGEGGGDGTV